MCHMRWVESGTQGIKCKMCNPYDPERVIVGVKPLLPRQSWNGLMISRPNGIMLAAAAKTPNNLCAWVVERCWPSQMSFTAEKMKYTRVGDERACIVVKSKITLRKVVLWEGERTLFSVFSQSFKNMKPQVGKHNISESMCLRCNISTMIHHSYNSYSV